MIDPWAGSYMMEALTQVRARACPRLCARLRALLLTRVPALLLARLPSRRRARPRHSLPGAAESAAWAFAGLVSEWRGRRCTTRRWRS